MFSKNANITIYTNETSNQIHPKNLVMKKLQHNTEYKSSSRNIQNASLLCNGKSWFLTLGSTGTCLTPQNHKDDKSCLDINKVAAKKYGEN